MNSYLTQTQRQSLIEQYLDCHYETGGDENDGTDVYLNRLSNPELIRHVKSTGWGISL